MAFKLIESAQTRWRAVNAPHLVARLEDQVARPSLEDVVAEQCPDAALEHALGQAREAAGDRDVRIAGGGATILEYVNAGLIDEFSIALSPVLFGTGIRLFEGVDAGRVALEPVRAEPSPRVTHLTYAVRPR